MSSKSNSKSNWQAQLAGDREIADFLKRYRRIAVVGLPADVDSDAVVEAEKLLAYNFEMMPVHSDCGNVLGHACVPHLHDLNEDVDIVLVLPAAHVRAVHLANEAIQKGVRVFWMQDHRIDGDIAELLMRAGIAVVAERNLEKEFFKRAV